MADKADKKAESPKPGKVRPAIFVAVLSSIFIGCLILTVLAAHFLSGETAKEKESAAPPSKTAVPDCANQKDVNFDEGEAVKHIPLAPCKSGWIITPPVGKWYADSLPANLKYTLCYQDGDCIYYDGTNKWNGVKRGVFQAIGDGTGELVVTVEYPDGKKTGVEPASFKSERAENAESSFEGTVCEILKFEGRLVVRTEHEEVVLYPGNSLVYDRAGRFYTWWALEVGDPVQVVMRGSRVSYIKYLG